MKNSWWLREKVFSSSSVKNCLVSESKIISFSRSRRSAELIESLKSGHGSLLIIIIVVVVVFVYFSVSLFVCLFVLLCNRLQISKFTLLLRKVSVTILIVDTIERLSLFLGSPFSLSLSLFLGSRFYLLSLLLSTPLLCYQLSIFISILLLQLQTMFVDLLSVLSLSRRASFEV